MSTHEKILIFGGIGIVGILLFQQFFGGKSGSSTSTGPGSTTAQAITDLTSQLGQQAKQTNTALQSLASQTNQALSSEQAQNQQQFKQTITALTTQIDQQSKSYQQALAQENQQTTQEIAAVEASNQAALQQNQKQISQLSSQMQSTMNNALITALLSRQQAQPVQTYTAPAVNASYSGSTSVSKNSSPNYAFQNGLSFTSATQADNSAGTYGTNGSTSPSASAPTENVPSNARKITSASQYESGGYQHMATDSQGNTYAW